MPSYLNHDDEDEWVESTVYSNLWRKFTNADITVWVRRDFTNYTNSNNVIIRGPGPSNRQDDLLWYINPSRFESTTASSWVERDARNMWKLLDADGQSICNVYKNFDSITIYAYGDAGGAELSVGTDGSISGFRAAETTETAETVHGDPDNPCDNVFCEECYPDGSPDLGYDEEADEEEFDAIQVPLDVEDVGPDSDPETQSSTEWSMYRVNAEPRSRWDIRTIPGVRSGPFWTVAEARDESDHRQMLVEMAEPANISYNNDILVTVYLGGGYSRQLRINSNGTVDAAAIGWVPDGASRWEFVDQEGTCRGIVRIGGRQVDVWPEHGSRRLVITRQVTPRVRATPTPPLASWNYTELDDGTFDEYRSGRNVVYVRRTEHTDDEARYMVLIPRGGDSIEVTEDGVSGYRWTDAEDGNWTHECGVSILWEVARTTINVPGTLPLTVYANGHTHDGTTERVPPPDPYEWLRTATVVCERKPLKKKRGTAYGKLLLGRGWGVELEYNRAERDDYISNYGCSPRNLAVALAEAGLDVRDEEWRSAGRREYSQWVCSTDGTVSGGECKSPILRGADTITPVRTAMKTIARLGGHVRGSNAGTHVHHDVNDLDATELVKLIDNLAACSDALLAYIPEPRLRQHYCGLPELAHFKAVRNTALRERLSRGGGGNAGERYRPFNFNSVLTYGSVEFRAHPGTLDSKRLEPWVAAGMAIVEFSRQRHDFGARQTPQSMMETFVDERLIHVDLARSFIKHCVDIYGEDVVTEPPVRLAA